MSVRHDALDDQGVHAQRPFDRGAVLTCQDRQRHIVPNAVVTEDVPEGATMVGVKARSTLVPAETYQKDFMPYGTPCSDKFDPATQKLELLQCEMDVMQKRLSQLLEERDAAAAKQSAGRKRGGGKSA